MHISHKITIEGKKGNKKGGIGNRISYLFIIGIYFNEGKEYKCSIIQKTKEKSKKFVCLLYCIFIYWL